MPRYFIEVSYKGAAYSGFQVQQNANTIQQQVELALEIFYKQNFELTGSSRTDAGVHALQNFFHFDCELNISPKAVYNLNAILPKDIVAKNIYLVKADAHCRFDADSRSYKYFIYQFKNTFVEDRAYYFPFAIDIEKLHETTAIILENTNFKSFSKKHTQVNNFNCNILQSFWQKENDCWVYNVTGSRFLRGMVRGLVATQLRVAKGLISIDDFKNIIESQDCNKAFFEVPAHGLFLLSVNYPDGYFKIVV